MFRRNQIVEETLLELRLKFLTNILQALKEMSWPLYCNSSHNCKLLQFSCIQTFHHIDKTFHRKHAPGLKLTSGSCLLISLASSITIYILFNEYSYELLFIFDCVIIV